MLIYSALASLDGYVADEGGRFEWAAPDEEVHAAVNDLVRPVGTFLLGRRMYEVLVAWETMDTSDASPAVRDFAAIWRGPTRSSTRGRWRRRRARGRGSRCFDPEAVRRMKAGAGRDIGVGGPGLAARRSGRGWSTSATCSSRPSWWVAGCGPSRTASAWASSCWASAASAAAWSTCATA